MGGIAAAIGLIIDDAIVVVEAVHAKICTRARRLTAVQQAVAEIFRPLLASTLTPVVVFIPLAFLDGVAGNFFQALALTMVVSFDIGLHADSVVGRLVDAGFWASAQSTGRN